MSVQYSVAVRNAQLDQFEATTGTSAKLRLYTGSVPVDCATAATGTLLADIALPIDYMNNAASGSKTKLGTWSGSASAAGTAGYFRIYDSAGTTCHAQGSAGMNVVLATNALTAANGNVLNFAATTGVVVGQNISGTGIPSNATVLAVTATTVTMSVASTAGVASAASITFGSDLVLDNTNLANAQVVTVNSFQINRGNA